MNTTEVWLIVARAMRDTCPENTQKDSQELLTQWIYDVYTISHEMQMSKAEFDPFIFFDECDYFDAVKRWAAMEKEPA